MSPKPQKSWSALVLSIALASAPVCPSLAYANGCTDNVVNKCTAAASSTLGTMGAGMALTGSSTTSAQNSGAAQTLAANNLSNQAASCASSSSECQACKKSGAPDSDVQSCQQQVAAKSAQMASQASSLGQSGMDTSALAGIIGAGLGILGAVLAAENKPPTTPPPPVATGALQLNGSLNCQMADSYTYLDCDTYLTQACTGFGVIPTTPVGPPVTGTIIATPSGTAASPDCASFNNRYCSPTVTAPTAYGDQLSNGVITQVNIAGSGEGLHTPYCQTAAATAWCNDPTYGPARVANGCGACRQEQSANSEACVETPALCLAQPNPAQVTQTQTNPVCSGDPLFSAGSPYLVGSPSVSGTATPVVMLEGQGGRGGTKGSPTGGGATVVTAQAIRAPSGSAAGGGGVAGALAATREGTGNGTGSSFTGGSGSGANFKASSSSTSDLVAAGGVIVASAPRQLRSRGPASDVEAQFGPSLFTTSTQVIHQRCQAGKLNNCP